MNESAEPKVRIGQVFVSSVAFDHREDALQLPSKTDVGNLHLRINVEVGTSQEGDHGFVRLRLETDKESKPLYLIRVEMIGIVEQLAGAEKFSARDYLISSGAFMMYPFMREFVANLTARARFGPIWIRPMNFSVLADQMQEKVDRETGAVVGES